jgi:hypothetical protein
VRIRQRNIIDRDNFLISEAQTDLLHRDVLNTSCRAEFLHLKVHLLANIREIETLFHTMVSILLAMLHNRCGEVRLI